METLKQVLLNNSSILLKYIKSVYDIDEKMASMLISHISDSMPKHLSSVGQNMNYEFKSESTIFINTLKSIDSENMPYTAAKFIKNIKQAYLKTILNANLDSELKTEYILLLDKYFDSFEIELTLELSKSYRKKLEESQEKYQILVEQTSNGISTTDFDGNYIEVNTKGCKLLGYTYDEILKMNISNIVFDVAIEKIKKGVIKLRNDESLMNEYPLKYIDGKQIVIEISAEMLSDGRMQGIIRDVTQKKYIEKSLRESEIRFKTLTEATSSCIFICSKSKILYANPPAERLTGYSMNELQKMSMVDIIHPDFRHILSDYILTESKNELSPEICEMKIITKNGEEKWISITVGSIQIDGEWGLLATAYDITDRNRIEMELQESEEKYKSLVELLPDGVFILDEDKILFSNDAGAKLLGAVNDHSVIGKKYNNFVHPNYRNLALSMIKYNMEKHLVPGPLFEMKLLRSNGTTVDVEVRNISFLSNQKPVVLSVCRDITDRKVALENAERLKQALEHDKLRTEFLSNMSHELRTPINVIISALQMCDLMDKNDSLTLNRDKLRKYISIMRQNCFRLIKLVNNLIDITKIESGYMQLNLHNYNIVNIIEDITLSVAEYIENKGINLVFDTSIEEKVIACDADKIERIMLNLLSNAVKFTDSGGMIKVNVSDNGKYVAISVKDTGIGIPEDKQKIIFERFVQADMSLSRPSEGSGIGLSLAKSLVELHGGCIYLNSKVGSGSEFIFEIPSVLLPDNSKPDEDFNCIKQSKVERINIEFSDIYS